VPNSTGLPSGSTPIAATSPSTLRSSACHETSSPGGGKAITYSAPTVSPDERVAPRGEPRRLWPLSSPLKALISPPNSPGAERRQLDDVAVLELHPHAVGVVRRDEHVEDGVHVGVVRVHLAGEDHRQLGGLVGRRADLDSAPLSAAPLGSRPSCRPSCRS
jgi:hypothetical protein